MERIHGLSGTRLYSIWKNMRARCNNQSYKGFHRYGGRGIRICAEWSDFIVFKEWAQKNGYADNLSIDRVDNDGGYCPNNCQWLTTGKNAQKRCNTKAAKHLAEIRALLAAGLPNAEIAKKFNLTTEIVWQIKRGETYI